jgi:WhiB family redox-sensing transcriptional regulator
VITKSTELQWNFYMVHAMRRNKVPVAIIAATLQWQPRRVYRALKRPAPSRPPEMSSAWRGGALCSGADPKLWVGSADYHSSEDIAEAKRICAMCPVRAACLGESLENEEPGGVWGGLTEEELRALTAGAAQPLAG